MDTVKNSILDNPPSDEYIERLINRLKSKNWQIKSNWNMNMSLDFYMGYYASMLIIIANVSDELKMRYLEISFDIIMIIDKKRKEL